ACDLVPDATNHLSVVSSQHTSSQLTMATTKISPSSSTESILLHLLCRVDAARHRALVRQRKRVTMSAEFRTLDFWRAVIAECLASFLYVFLLCATHLTWTGSMFIFGPAPNWLVIALRSEERRVGKECRFRW